MDIKIKCDRDFELALDNMRHKYGEDFEFLNGLHESQIDTTEFINGFIDKANVADATIDSNANVTNKDVRSLLNEKGKAEEKLLCFNKIFYELKKKYGLTVAREWLEAEWNGTFYMHDASSSSILPYCFRGDTKVITNFGLLRMDELVGRKDIEVINKNRGWEAAEVKCFGKQNVRELTLKRFDTIQKFYVTNNHKWFIRTNHGIEIVETKDLKPGMKIPFNTLIENDEKSKNTQYIDWEVIELGTDEYEEDVYCVEAPATNSFTLEGNVLTHNCYAFSLDRLAREGLFFLKNYNPEPAKHLTTFLDHVIEFISFFSNRSSGACGLPNILIWTFYFWKKDIDNGYYIKDPEYYLKQCFQKLIYRLNQPFLRIKKISVVRVKPI